MKFAYMPLALRQSSPSLRGATLRYRPIVPVRFLAPMILSPIDGCLDCAADDTVFPLHIALRLGVDLRKAQTGQLRSVGGAISVVHYAPVTILLSDGYELCEWDAIVGFATVPMQWALLGHAGFLEYFDVQLFGARHETIITPNSTFSGHHAVHPRSP